jgi:hypothetical protein
VIPWSEDGPTGAIQLLEMAMVTVGSDEPAEVHGFIERRLNAALLQWARTGKGSSHVEALWIAWSMMRFHTLAAAARYELSDSDVERQEELETIIIRIREAARKHQDWGLALQQLAAEIDPLLKPPW